MGRSGSGVRSSFGNAISWVCCFLCLTGCQHHGSEASPEAVCERNLGLLGKGIAGYRNTHGTLPQCFVGPEGHAHSWRTLVVPYVFHEESVTTYRFDQPWDSSSNREALWPEGFLLNLIHKCPLDPRAAEYPFFTSYLMLVRPPIKDSETDEMRAAMLPTDAVLIVESVGCGIEFAKPRDIDWADLWESDSPFGQGKLNSFHPGVVKALRVDGTVINIPKDISHEDLRNLLRGSTTQGRGRSEPDPGADAK